MRTGANKMINRNHIPTQIALLVQARALISEAVCITKEGTHKDKLYTTQDMLTAHINKLLALDIDDTPSGTFDSIAKKVDA